MIQAREFRDAMGLFATGVTVVTGLDPQRRPVGMTVNSLTSVSLDPPLVLFCPAKSAESYGAFTAGGRFAINVLSEQQQHLSVQFAAQGEEKWHGVQLDLWDDGLPVLRGCLVSLQCETHAIHEAGDHAVVIGRVTRIGELGRGLPLLYFGGAYARIGGAE